jgi:hypothetical protein
LISYFLKQLEEFEGFLLPFFEKFSLNIFKAFIFNSNRNSLEILNIFQSQNTHDETMIFFSNLKDSLEILLNN